MALKLIVPPFSGGYKYEVKSLIASIEQQIGNVWPDPAGLGSAVSEQMTPAKVSAAKLFIVSYGLIRLAVGYFSFSQKSKQIKEKAESLLEVQCDKEVSAIKLWQDYHLSRASAPLLPTWIWWLREKKLNALFKAYFHDLA